MRTKILPYAIVLPWLAAGTLSAQQQQQGLCALVKMEIAQELAIERIGFLATLKITNNIGDGDITDFSAYLTFENPDLSTEEEAHDASDLFFVQPPDLSGIDSIDGTGVIPASKTATIQWFIIPKIAAGGTSPVGVEYEVGAQLAGRVFGNDIDPQLLTVYEDTITVRPEPQLTITYFQPRDVQGDDPFTEFVESPIPFTLGVLVENTGYGLARNVRIKSQQPRIVENRERLLLIAKLLGVRLDDEPLDEKSLTLELGDIEPGQCRKGAWDMITSLSGEFTEFKASYTHASELGGRDTSVITSLEAHFISREMLVDLPGRDRLLDFLADTDRNLIPDAIYETDCNVLPVNHLEDVTVERGAGQAILRVNADREDWVYLRVSDPAQARLPIERVRRSDGKILHPRNAWTNVRYQEGTNDRLAYLNLVDFVSLGDLEYVVQYGSVGDDTDPPVTTIRFSGPVESVGERYFVTRDTQIFFTSEDASPVAIEYRLDDGEFQPAIPFTISEAGEHIVEYFATDERGNEEAPQTATVVLSDEPPALTDVELQTESIFHSAQTLSVRPSEAAIAFRGSVASGRLDAELDVFRGIRSSPTISGVPSTPTRSDTATLTVGGELVDFYRYRIGGGNFQSEQPVSEPLELEGLSGVVTLTVNGRHEHGEYNEGSAVTVSWTVDGGAPPTVVEGAPPTPTRRTTATLSVSGVPEYRHSQSDFDQFGQRDASLPLELSGLDGQIEVDFLGKIGPGAEDFQDESAPTTVRWRVDSDYGFDFSELERVRHELLEDIDDTLQNLVWDGTDDDGVLVPAGFYTLRLTLRDALGRRTRAVEVVQVESLLPRATPISDSGAAGQRHPSVAAGWVVWQDQRAGDWDIYARDLNDPADEGHVLHRTPLNQERPHTDGEVAVWEERREDGVRDVWARRLASETPAFPIQPSANTDVARAAVDWPWVVFQARPVNEPDHPWQLVAYDLRDGTTFSLDPTTQDQLDPSIDRGRVVWQDLRDAGSGEIYFHDLGVRESVRLTDDIHGQFHPVIEDQWIVWDDNRHAQTEIYGYNLLRNTQVRLTDTPENETRPSITGNWITYEEDSSGGALDTNLRLLDLATGGAVQLTNFDSRKRAPAFTSGHLIWEEIAEAGPNRVVRTTLPGLQSVFANRNAVAVTPAMVEYLVDAYTLLEAWNLEAGATELTRFTSLTPVLESETAEWIDAAPSGTNFPLIAGEFVWVRFDAAHVLDLGEESCPPIDLASGINVVSYVCFPDAYASYDVIDELGPDAVRALRRLDPRTGEWLVATRSATGTFGDNFSIPRVSILILDMNSEVDTWNPGR